jgi:hypothetical protein
MDDLAHGGDEVPFGRSEQTRRVIVLRWRSVSSTAACAFA